MFQNAASTGYNIVFYEEGILGCSKFEHTSSRGFSEIYYFLDSLGHEINQAEQAFIEIKPFQNGLAIVKIGEDIHRYGVIDKKGFYVIQPKYQKIFRQPDGSFKAIIRTHYGISKKDGTLVHPAKYDTVSPIFHRKTRFGNYRYILRMEYGDTIEYLDEKGNWIWKK